MLGIPKTIPSLLSGEMRDTAILGQLESVLGLTSQNPLGGIVSNTLGTVASTFRTWGSLWAMLPRGGTDIWGADDALGAPDDVTRAPDEASIERDANETGDADEAEARAAASRRRPASHGPARLRFATFCPSASRRIQRIQRIGTGTTRARGKRGARGARRTCR